MLGYAELTGLLLARYGAEFRDGNARDRGDDGVEKRGCAHFCKKRNASEAASLLDVFFR
ncbi:hypothetical protein OGR47_15495 [Methylocystis sp. MJC1]|jgi:hypothetical protein|uniref:hypothetical protein n=1 Tax=Methylocystis sp. MJC1 TaxID=2654282 RepID=UPI0013EC127F|nr:hypothetical protein [Methylocystis sp. MJC1]MBU6528363.1 hypothetical protein [Methylocystis sp. MJC1]UZX11268.1 hypothetical protein OGR47_15495 [Methylocystis sp. MJC1]